MLPFADVSPDADQAYFVDGLSEELLNALGKLEGLRVIGRTSSFSFRGRDDDAQSVGAALGVRHVLEGSVRRDGDRCVSPRGSSTRATARSSGRTPTIGTLGDVFEIQKEIAGSVATTLELALRPARATSAGATQNIEAYDAYLAARAVMNTGGTPRAREAIALLERAVDVDSDFAPRGPGSPRRHVRRGFPGGGRAADALEVQRQRGGAALRAFELAPTRAETLRAAGMVSMQNAIGPRPSGVASGRGARRAVRLRCELPLRVVSHERGPRERGDLYEERAMRAEPLLMRPVTFLAALYEMRGDLDEAEALLASSARLTGHEQMRREALFMIGLARQDRDDLRRLMLERGDPPHSLLDDPPLALEELRQRYADAAAPGARSPFLSVAIFASSWATRSSRSTRCASSGLRRTCTCSGAGRCARSQLAWFRGPRAGPRARRLLARERGLGRVLPRDDGRRVRWCS